MSGPVNIASPQPLPEQTGLLNALSRDGNQGDRWSCSHEIPMPGWLVAQ
jgi:hypothetical protein